MSRLKLVAVLKVDVPASMDKLAIAQWFLNQYNILLGKKIQGVIATEKEDHQTFKSSLQDNTNLTNLIRKIAV